MFVCIVVQERSSLVFVGTAGKEFVVDGWDVNRCPAVAQGIAFFIKLSAVIWLFHVLPSTCTQNL